MMISMHPASSCAACTFSASGFAAMPIRSAAVEMMAAIRFGYGGEQ